MEALIPGADLKMSFGPSRQRRTRIFVADSFRILDPLRVDLRLKARPRCAWSQNPISEMASNLF
jgi:hypothetical protein